MRHLVAAAKPSRRRHLFFSVSPYHQLSTTTTSGTNSSHLCSFYDPAAQFLPSGSPRHLSLPTSLRRDSILGLARILKSSLQCHLALRTLTSQTPPLHARFAAASRLAILSPALRPFASLLLAALLPAASPHLLAWCASPGGAPYAALRLALHAFLAAGMPAEALVVLARIRSVGKTPSLSALATLLRLLFREGNVQAAWKVFVEMTAMGPRPSLPIFNAMILGLCHMGLVPVAVGLLGVMWRFHVIPDACSYNILIKGHCVFGQAGDAFELFEKMHKSGCEPTVVTYNILVNVRCRDGNMVEARRLFDEMVAVGVEANTITFNVLIDGYAKTGQMDEADAAYREMKERGLLPDCCTFNILSAGAYKFGKTVHLAHEQQELYEMFGSQISADNIDMTICRLCWDGRLDDARQLVCCAIEQGAPVSVAGFNALIAAYSKEGFEEEALELYKLMKEIGLAPLSSTFNYLILGLCNQGRLDDAQLLLEHMISKGYSVGTSFTVYMDSCFRSGNVEGALKCWDDMVKVGGQPDFIAFSAYISGLCRLDHVNEAYRAFVEMTRRGLVPNNITYNSLISAFCRVGHVAKALKLEQKMRQSGLVPDVFTSNILIDGFCREGRLDMVNNRFLDMRSSGLTPDVVTYNTIINAYCRAQDMNGAMVFMNKMLADGCDPDIFTYNIWIHSLCNNHSMNRAARVLDELVAVGFTPNSVTYNTLMDGICNDVLDRAMILTGKLIKMAFQPNTITVNVFFSHFCKQGLGRRALLWAEKLREDSVAFDDATMNILDWASKEMDDDLQGRVADIDKCMFLEFLMLITYNTMSNNRSPKFRHVPVETVIVPAGSNTIKVLDTG
ncbi:hypothetical protein VPH35_128837 [Triticum aestivum]|uniref:Pentatricopeptide repeat-containing protein n=2 Tax=Triticum TaxID=4564 RepID=A0A9R1A0S6_TRITD|nr:pentatricopeptide repeat-containing protein At3g22470, mitochondrial-like [Triticum aestivum]XP_044430903.1 pentatricopeptide repeat-containing protein At3g22470, mitochondrial-like [Triticum aestivum]XP_044430904.1 pentatricopeptide repeat-containing protein At3g22470, mitochondrial-like [Triticum aestivum]XP_044430905.1 pentatricopeptide repeat-containing protein At3g22470, mitochondrial-like [Triticum aestivum]XP_044430906.1 pentatricopeptide repeat-containing protein At3g22470, mitochond